MTATGGKVNQETFSNRDRSFLAAHGISVDEARHQIELLNRGTPFVDLDRPARVKDGIHCFSPHEADRLAGLYEDHLERVQVTKFVPASGAATRMFAVPSGFLSGRYPVAAGLLSRECPPESGPAAFLFHFFSGLREGRFAFDDELDAALRRQGASLRRALKKGEYRWILSTLLEPEHLGYANRPKALIPFHREQGREFTPVEEHLAEAVAYGRGSKDICRVHFTVAPEHQEAIRIRVNQGLSRFQGLVQSFHVSYSLQHPATDTLAISPQGSLFRDEAENLLLRPGGHGALLRNLDALNTDLAFIKNIDNVVPPRHADVSTFWKKVLGGFLLRQQQRVFQLLRDLHARESGALSAAEKYINEVLGQTVPAGLKQDARLDWTVRHLDRPIRVCGMVRNQGEPGGGPFWVRDAGGSRSLQIVESAQINHEDCRQAEVVRESTHFNPVDMVCGLRNFREENHRLHNYVNPETYFVSSKTHSGRPLKALEWPGLWNGAMHHWLTFFVEIPLSTFTPVKTVNDLLRDEHQGDSGN